MGEIKFATGVKEYRINDAVTVYFNPTDVEFARKIYAAFDELDKQQERYRAEIKRIEGTPKIFEYARERDTDMRRIIDDLFGREVCNELFGGVNVYAMADGLPIWCNLMLAVIDELDAGLNREQRATSARVQKYTSKYHK